MDNHISEYYGQFGDTPRGNFHKVIPLHDHPEMSWEEISEMMPNLCKGWFELAQLDPKDRVEFTCDFWLARLPYHPLFPDFIMHFFENVDDIGIFVVQKKFDDPFEANLVYSLKGDIGFFRGSLPASQEQIEALQTDFSDFILPSDYLAFLQIHNGFSKTTDCTGLIPSTSMLETYKAFQGQLQTEGALMTTKNVLVDPKKVIPFYESFGMPFYQCFWSEWYPEQEMGNVYYSGMTRTISDVAGVSSDTMAFPTFLDWLMFYMERIE